MADAEKMPQKANAELTRFWPMILAIAVGVLAWVLSAWIYLPTPKAGLVISSRYYSVNLLQLRSSREVWGLNGTDSGDGVHDIADQLAKSFLRSKEDAALTRFLNKSAEATTTVFGRLNVYVKEYVFWSLQRYLGWSKTDASGAIGTTELYVASTQQLYALVKDFPLGSVDGGPPKLLDVGSGRGTETEKLAVALDVDREHVTCVEVSSSMRAALSERGFHVVGNFGDLNSSTGFAAAALFNVLDRCDEPLLILEKAINLLRPNGLLLIATPLPFSARVWEGKIGSTWQRSFHRSPRSPIMPHEAYESRTFLSSTFEFSAAAFIASLFPKHSGVDVLAWTRLPYLSAGDSKITHYALDAALFLLRIPASVQRPSRPDGAMDHSSESDVALPI